MNARTSLLPVLLAGATLAAGGCGTCGGGSTGQGAGAADAVGAPDRATSPEPGGDEAAGPTSRVLLVAQSTFARAESGRWTQPDAARVYVLRQTGSGWDREEIVDPESNVFHKAMVYADEGQAPAVLTIGANKAALKLWRRGQSGWQAETIWQPTFGGTHDRLRDVELADVDGDGRQDIVLATHDQGVVAVVRRTPSGWEPVEIARAANTFVHEVEVGDLDGDGRPEIYATPSHPNLGAGGAQPGQITRHAWTGEGWVSEVVADFDRRHAKEILVADLDRDGRPELYAAIEAETEASGGLGGRVVHPVEIRRFARGESGWTSEVVATIEDRQCRFLVAGDLDGDGSPELVAAAMTTGVWMFEPGASLPWPGRNLERDTGGFEHAALIADIEGDGSQELYVADDTHGRLLRYGWRAEGGGLSEPEVLLTRAVPQSAMTWNLWVAELPAR